MNYDEACAWHADNQGLGPMIDALWKADVKYDLLQTGGFCMALAVEVENEGDFIITFDDEQWVIGWYRGGWNNRDDEPVPTWFRPTVPEALTLLRAETTPDPDEVYDS